MNCRMCKSCGIESTVIMQDKGHSVMNEKSGYIGVDGVYVPPKKVEMFFTQYKCSKGHVFTSSSRQPSQEVETQV